RCNFLEQLNPFPGDGIFCKSKTSRIATGSREAFHKPATNRIGDVHEYNRDGAGCLQHRSYGRGAIGEDDVRRERDQFGRVSAIEFGIAWTPAIVNSYVAADRPTQLLQRPQECRIARLSLLIVRG